MNGYRYTLTRDVGPGPRGCLCWVMLNPSTADDTFDDPTIRRVKRFTGDAGYQRLVVVNLFAARATNPDDLPALDDPSGDECNGKAIADAFGFSDAVVCAWGDHRLVRSQLGFSARTVIDRLARSSGRDLLCLGVTRTGQPRHPLYVPASDPLIPFGRAA